MLLNLHSYYSLRYGTLSIEALIEGMLQHGYDQAVLTDINHTIATFASCTLLFAYSCTDTNHTEQTLTDSSEVTVSNETTQHEEDVQKNIQKVIDLFKANDIKGIAALAEYPVKRPNPLPSLKNAEEFVANFKLMFPNELLTVIKNSTVSDWDAIGSNGIVISDASGEHSIWLQDGGATIKVINSTTPEEEVKRNSVLEQSRNEVHESLKNFASTEFIITTPKYKVRIDLMKDETYRYAAWNNPNAAMSSAPDIVVLKGEGLAEGRLGDMAYTFQNGKITYLVSTNMFGESGSSDANLTVTDGKKEVLNQDGKIIFGN